MHACGRARYPKNVRGLLDSFPIFEDGRIQARRSPLRLHTWWRAGGFVSWELGGRVLGFGPVLNSIIGVNSGGFPADARRPSDRLLSALALPCLALPPLSIYPSALTCPSVRPTSFRMTKAYFSPPRKMMPPIGNSARAPSWNACIHSFIPNYTYDPLLSLQMIYPQPRRTPTLT